MALYTKTYSQGFYGVSLSGANVELAVYFLGCFCSLLAKKAEERQKTCRAESKFSTAVEQEP